MESDGDKLSSIACNYWSLMFARRLRRDCGRCQRDFTAWRTELGGNCPCVLEEGALEHPDLKERVVQKVTRTCIWSNSRGSSNNNDDGNTWSSCSNSAFAVHNWTFKGLPLNYFSPIRLYFLISCRSECLENHIYFLAMSFSVKPSNLYKKNEAASDVYVVVIVSHKCGLPNVEIQITNNIWLTRCPFIHS